MILIIAVVCWIMMKRIYAETECKSFLLFMILCIFVFYYTLTNICAEALTTNANI